MTLALYGKSGKRKAALMVAAFLAIFGAIVGAAATRGSVSAADTLPSNVTLEQWETAPSGGWITGALQQNNSDYAEGEVVPFRLTVPASIAAGDYEFSVCREYRPGVASSVRGYLFLDGFDTDRAATAGGVISDTLGVFQAVNADLTSVVENALGDAPCGTNEWKTTVVFTKPAGESLILWGGHLAAPPDAGVGAGNGASNFSGGSLHMRIGTPDKSVGIQNNAIIPSKYIHILKVVTNVVDDPWVFYATIDDGAQHAFNEISGSYWNAVAPGSHVVTEAPQAGYATLGWARIDAGTTCPADVPNSTGGNVLSFGTDNTAEVTLAATDINATVVCFYNEKLPAEPGFIDVYKVVTNVADDPTLFDADIDGGTPFTFSELSPSLSHSVATGPKVVTEAPESGYTTLGWATIFGGTACPDLMPTGPGGNVISFGADNTAEVTVATNNTNVICFFNEKSSRTIRVQKVTATAVHPAATFGGTIVPGSQATFSLDLAQDASSSPAQSRSVSTAAQTIAESTPPAGWTLDGYRYVLDTGAAPATCPGEGYTPDGNVIPAGSDAYLMCIKNSYTPPTGSIRITKVDLTLSGDATRPAHWDFSVTGPSSATPQVELGGTRQVTVLDRAMGTYTVTEVQAHSTTACPALPNTAQQGYFTEVANSDNTLNTAGEMIEWTFTNRPCPSELAAPNLTVQKAIDFNGDRAFSGGIDEFADGWHITVNCGPGNVFEANTGGPGHIAFFDGLPGNTTCTISETPQAGYNPTGWQSMDTGSGAGASTSLHMDNGDQNRVTFFNQPLVNIRVHKDVVTNAGSANGAGWTFTLTGCGITPQAKTTDAAGNADFTGLPAALACTYTVTETEQAGWTVSPAVSQTAAPTAPGSTAILTFTNLNFIPCGAPCVPTPTATPTVPPPPPPPPPEVTEVAGERTAGPPESTPIAPSAGTGTVEPGGPEALIVLALAAAAMAGSAFAITILARKPSR